MPAVSGLLKPCYVYAPRVLIRRIGLMFGDGAQSLRNVTPPWGTLLEINPDETIGRELLRQNIFDIGMSETAWRLLAPGAVAVDVGANIGYTTSLFAMRCGVRGAVEAFEPHPRIVERLKRNIAEIARASGAAPVRLHACALGDREAVVQLLEPEAFGYNEGTARIGSEPSGASGFNVEMRRLDSSLGERHVTLLKVDVEGFEPEVIAGAEGLLARHAIDHIIYEAHDCERSPVHRMLERHGYSIFGIGHSLFGPRISPGTARPAVDGAWESPSYLATLRPAEALLTLRPRGWRVLAAS